MTYYMREGMAEFEGCPSAPGCMESPIGCGVQGLGDIDEQRARRIGRWTQPSDSYYRISRGTRTHVYRAPFFPQGGGPGGSWDALPWGSVVRLDPRLASVPGTDLDIPVQVAVGVGATGVNYGGRSGWLPSWVHLTRVGVPLTRVGRSRAVLGLGAIPGLESLGLGLNLKTVAIVAALAFGASMLLRKKGRKHNRRRGRGRRRNSPYRVKAIYQTRPAAMKAYGALPSGEMYKSIVDRNPRDTKSHRRGSGKFDTRAVLDKTRGLPMHAF